MSPATMAMSSGLRRFQPVTVPSTKGHRARDGVERRDEAPGQTDLSLGVFDCLQGGAERAAARDVKRNGGGRKLPEMGNQQRPLMLVHVDNRGQRNLPVAARCR